MHRHKGDQLQQRLWKRAWAWTGFFSRTADTNSLAAAASEMRARFDEAPTWMIYMRACMHFWKAIMQQYILNHYIQNLSKGCRTVWASGHLLL